MIWASVHLGSEKGLEGNCALRRARSIVVQGSRVADPVCRHGLLALALNSGDQGSDDSWTRILSGGAHCNDVHLGAGADWRRHSGDADDCSCKDDEVDKTGEHGGRDGEAEDFSECSQFFIA